MDDRTLIAGMAMQALIPSANDMQANVEQVCFAAREYADAILAELSKTKPKCTHRRLDRRTAPDLLGGEEINTCLDCGEVVNWIFWID